MNLSRFDAEQLRQKLSMRIFSLRLPGWFFARKKRSDRKRLHRLSSFLLGIALVFATAFTPMPGLAQLGAIAGGSSDQTVVGWVSLDGRQVIQIAAPSAALSVRRQNISENLTDIRDAYVGMPAPEVNIEKETAENADTPSLYINGRYLMTLIDADARMQGTTIVGLEQTVREDVSQALQQAYEERQPAYLRQAGLMAAGAIAGAIVIALLLQFSRYLLSDWIKKSLPDEHAETLVESHHRKFHVIRHLLLPLLQFVIVAAAITWSLGLFPHVRAFQNSLISWAKVPASILIIAVVAYLGVRISYAFIDRFISTLEDRSGVDFDSQRRLNLRISTISSVVKNIANFVWIIVGFIIALTVLGIDLGLLLASFGIFGLALSLASQNLIKGAVTGFFILLEDQYAIGDVVKIGDDAGLVENMNLRVTQLRDTEGRLITIPTSDIVRVANYSLHWSRCDLHLPVDYAADIDEMLQLVRELGSELRNDSEWGKLILEDPDILGVENFGDNAITIRLWIKTQPLKQWEVSREYRRRFKRAIENAQLQIPYPQRQVWLNAPDGLKINLSDELHQVAESFNRGFSSNGQRDSVDGDRKNGDRHSNGNASNGHHRYTDHQPSGTVSESEGPEAEAEANAET